MTTLERIIKNLNRGSDIVGDTINYEYDGSLSYEFIHILYRSFDEKRTNLKIRKGFDWIYVHIIYLRITDKSAI